MIRFKLEQARQLALANRTDAAIACYRQILELEPGHLAAAVGAWLTLPQIYPSQTDVQLTRDRFAAGLRWLLVNLQRFARLPPQQCFEQIFWVNFHLAYQGHDDTRLQSDYGDFVASLISRQLPALCLPLPPASPRGRRIRVGFASGFFRQCTVGGYFQRWITHLDRMRFETFVYHSSPRHDALTRRIASQCDHFVDLAAPEFGSLESCGKRILDDHLDALVYPELGMDPHAFLLASLRLAPVQCAGWGHPVTSGLASIDYFLSSQDAEPPYADQHYRETLILLDGLGVSYPRPPCSSAKKRADFGLPEATTLYLCPQSLCKLHPDFDPLLARVLAQDDNGRLLLFEADTPALTRCYLDRLSSIFSRFDLDLGQRVIVLPYLKHPDYLALNRVCDAMLDPPYWSGGNTALDALASGLPIVTFEGRFMRGRQSAAMLKQLGMPQLIANDFDDYLRIVHALVHDTPWRGKVIHQLRDRVDALFDQTAAMASFERFLQRAVDD